MSNKKLDSLVGKEWLYAATRQNLTVQSWAVNDGIITLQTDKGPLTCAFGEHDEWIKTNFLAVEQESGKGVITLSVKAPANSVFNGNVLGELRDTLLDNIRKVKEDKEFIPQAQSINDQVKSVIDLAKTEIDFYKTAAALSR